MIEFFVHFLNQYGIVAILVLIAAEYVGIPLPTELGYITGQRLISQGVHSYWYVFLIIMVGHFIGSMFSYELGRRASNFASKRQKLSSVQKRIKEWYKHYGAPTIFVTQLIGHVRPWASYIAGFSGIGRVQFMFYSLIGSATLTYIMLALSQTIVRIWVLYPWVRVALVAVFAGIVVGMVAVAVRGRLRRLA